MQYPFLLTKSKDVLFLSSLFSFFSGEGGRRGNFYPPVSFIMKKHSDPFKRKITELEKETLMRMTLHNFSHDICFQEMKI